MFSFIETESGNPLITGGWLSFAEEDVLSEELDELPDEVDDPDVWGL